MLSIAFKEWAAICAALSAGEQSLILRKGGIAEENGEFRPEYDQFFLYPTYFHEQQQRGLKPTAERFRVDAERQQPIQGTISIQHMVQVKKVIRCDSLNQLQKLDSFHFWTAETITQRFHYRTPGLFALIVQVFELPAAVVVPEDPSYFGCKSWVPLVKPIPTANIRPVLTDDQFAAIEQSVTKAYE